VANKKNMAKHKKPQGLATLVDMARAPKWGSQAAATIIHGRNSLSIKILTGSGIGRVIAHGQRAAV
jgi:hypothetical protein